MSQHLPVISGRDVVRALCRGGYEVVAGRGKGSHIVVHHPVEQRLITVPAHDPVRRGTLRAIIRQASLTVDEFRRLLDA